MNMVKEMTREEVKAWTLQEHEIEGLTPEDIEHVVDCLWSLHEWYWHDRFVGHFLTAVLKNDFGEACGRADGVNSKVLPIYDKFLYNCIPADYKEKLRKE
jgi:hypothetical protein